MFSFHSCLSSWDSMLSLLSKHPCRPTSACWCLAHCGWWWNVQGYICALITVPLLVITDPGLLWLWFLSWTWNVFCFATLSFSFSFFGGRRHLNYFLFWLKSSFSSFSALSVSPLFFNLSGIPHILWSARVSYFEYKCLFIIKDFANIFIDLLQKEKTVALI